MEEISAPVSNLNLLKLLSNRIFNLEFDARHATVVEFSSDLKILVKWRNISHFSHQEWNVSILFGCFLINLDLTLPSDIVSIPYSNKQVRCLISWYF
jgi:hypothetical protein